MHTMTENLEPVSSYLFTKGAPRKVTVQRPLSNGERKALRKLLKEASGNKVWADTTKECYVYSTQVSHNNIKAWAEYLDKLFGLLVQTHICPEKCENWSRDGSAILVRSGNYRIRCYFK